MPTYRVTGPNGRTLTIDGPQPPSEQELDQIFAQMGGTAPEQEQEDPSLFGRTLNVVGRIGNTLGRLGSATAGIAKEGVEAYQQGQDPLSFAGDALTAVKDTFTPTGIGTFKRNTDFDEVLGQAGYQEGWGRAGAGLVGDILIDPLNLVTGAGIAKAASKIPGATKVGNVAGDAARAVGQSRPLQAAKNALEEVFVQYPGLDDVKGLGELTARDKFRLHDSTKRHIGEAAVEEAGTLFKGHTQDDLTKMLHEIDATGASTTLPQTASGWRQAMDQALAEKQAFGMTNKAQKNYVPYMTKNPTPDITNTVVGSPLKGVTRSDLPRKKYTSLSDAVTQGGATDNAPELYVKYMTAHGRAVENNKFLAQMATEFGSQTPKAGQRTIKALNVPDQLNQYLKGTYFDSRLADELERAVVLWDKPTEMDNLYQTASKLWKGTVTSLVPGHHFTNLLGNMTNMYIGGMPLKDVAKGYAKAWGWSAGKLKDAYAPDLLKAARKYEVIGTSGQMSELVQEGTSKVLNNRLLKFAREKGTKWVEEPARLAMFDHYVSQGLSFEKAALKVKDVLFDYAELTDKERKIRDYAVPFYTWMRKNLPLQIKAIKENPKALEKLGDVTDMPWNANETQTEQQVLPEGLISQGYAPSSVRGPDGELVLNRVALPTHDINRLTDPKLLGDAAHPLLKMVAEGSYGRRLHSGQPIDQPDGMVNPSGFAKMMSPLNKILPESLEGYLTPMDTAKGPQQWDRWGWASSYLPGGFWGQVGQIAGSTMADPPSPRIPTQQDLALRFLGLTPDMITGEDSKREFQRRQGEMKRQLAQDQQMDWILEP